jgi:hypothetical protein
MNHTKLAHIASAEIILERNFSFERYFQVTFLKYYNRYPTYRIMLFLKT